MRKRSESSARARPPEKSAEHILDSEIDFSDIPESTDEELKWARRVGRAGPGKPLIAFRLEASLLQRLRSVALSEKRSYQTLIHEIIERSVRQHEMIDDGALEQHETYELMAALQESIAALDHDTRLVFTLKFFHQLSYEEIAEITGFSIPKLKRNLQLVRTEFRRKGVPRR